VAGAADLGKLGGPCNGSVGAAGCDSMSGSLRRSKRCDSDNLTELSGAAGGAAGAVGRAAGRRSISNKLGFDFAAAA
jgi:hypothetical protein